MKYTNLLRIAFILLALALVLLIMWWFPSHTSR